MPKTIPLGTYLFIHKCRCIMLNYLSVEVDCLIQIKLYRCL